MAAPTAGALAGKTLFPNTGFNSISSFTPTRFARPFTTVTPTRCSLKYRDAVAAADAAHLKSSAYPRPSDIQWKKELANSIQLIGIVGTDVQVNQLNSGKVLAWTRLAVRKSPTETTWISLTFWDEMAHIAYQHVLKGDQIYVSGRLKGDQIYVSGRLISDTVMGNDGKQQTYYKVVVQNLNFVERNFSPPVTLYDDSSSSIGASGSTTAASGGWKPNNSSSDTKLSPEALWQAFFANPTEWWDNRKTKKNPKYPDFKHRDTGEALWIDSRNSPAWVKSQLAVLDSRMEALRDDHGGGQFDFQNGSENYL